jgi:fatty acid desaturase
MGKLTTTIDGVTYDMTDFVNKHPGGADMLMLASGIDSSIMFHSYHRRLDVAEAVLAKLPKISGKPQASAIETPFWKDMKKNVNQYFIDTKQSSRGNALMYFKTFALLFLTWLSYYLCMQGYWIFAPILGVFIAINGLAVQHDANHGSFSNIGIVNTLFGAVDDVILGGSSLMWRHQHNIAHHAHPNDCEKDTDTYSNFPILKTNPKLPSRAYLKFQHIYAPFIYSLLGVAYYFGDFTTFFQGAYDKIKIHPRRTIDYVIFLFGKLFYGYMFFYLPLYYHGWEGFFKFILPFQLIGSNFLASLFIVSHNAEECEYNYKGNDWAEMQVVTAANWSVHSTAWWLVSGGLNFQIEHHLFPGICHVHYPAISSIVRDTCKKHKVPYHAHDTFYEIYTAHLRGLYQLGHMK